MGDEETVSGERYDANDWTARSARFGAKMSGVRFGKNYQPSFALVQSSDKQADSQINDIGPLRAAVSATSTSMAMRDVDPTLELELSEQRQGNARPAGCGARPVTTTRRRTCASRFDR